MKQKIVIKISVNCDKCRKKAMKVAAAADGVTSIALEGDDKLVVVGDGVDAACLTATLRKKACYASLQIVQEVKPKPPEPVKPPGNEGKDKDKDKDEGKEKDKDKGKDDKENQPTLPSFALPPCTLPPYPPFYCQPFPYGTYDVVQESYGPTPWCNIM